MMQSKGGRGGGQVSVAAARKRKERENAEAVKARLQAILDRDCASIVPPELWSKEKSRKGAKRSTIDIDRLLHDCIVATKCLLDLDAGNAASSSSSSTTVKDQPAPLAGGGRGESSTSPSRQPVPLARSFPPESHLQMRGLYSHREAWQRSTMAGTMLIRTGNLSVIEANIALTAFWELPFEMHCHCLEGQSLWALVHFDDHDTVTEMQESFLRRDKSIVGRAFDLGLIRMTGARVGGVAQCVRRRVEVLHLSPDGGAALLGIIIKDQDKRPLFIPPGWESMSRGTSVVKTKFLNRFKGGDDGDNDDWQSSGGLLSSHGMSMINYENICDALARAGPEVFIIQGMDGDGILRHMAFLRLCLQTYTHAASLIPILNLRLGGCRMGKESIINGQQGHDFAWSAWMLPGDDAASLQQIEPNGRPMPGIAFNYLQPVFSRTVSPTGRRSDILVGYVRFSPSFILPLTRKTKDFLERRPDSSISHQTNIISFEDWEEMGEDTAQLLPMFKFWEGQPSFQEPMELAIVNEKASAVNHLMGAPPQSQIQPQEGQARFNQTGTLGMYDPNNTQSANPASSGSFWGIGSMGFKYPNF